MSAGIAFGNGMFLAAGTGSMATSRDGVTWESIGKQTAVRSIYFPAFCNGMWFLGGTAGYTGENALAWALLP
jgi:hypothetical protein